MNIQKIKKSRQYFPFTEEGWKEYDKQWNKDEQFGPAKFRTNYHNWTLASEYPKPI